MVLNRVALVSLFAVLAFSMCSAGCGGTAGNPGASLAQPALGDSPRGAQSCPPIYEPFDWPMWGECMQNYRGGRDFPHIDDQLEVKWETEALDRVHSTPAQGKIERDWNPLLGQYRAMEHVYVIDEDSTLTAIDAHRTSPGGEVPPVWQWQMPHGDGLNYSSPAVSDVVNFGNLPGEEGDPHDQYQWVYALDDTGGFHVYVDFGVDQNMQLIPPLEVFPHDQRPELALSWDYAIGSPVIVEDHHAADGTLWLYFGGYTVGQDDNLYAVRIQDLDGSEATNYAITVFAVDLHGDMLSTPVVGEDHVFVVVSDVTLVGGEPGEPPELIEGAVVKSFGRVDQGAPFQLVNTSPWFHWYDLPDASGCETLASPIFVAEICVPSQPGPAWLYVSGPTALHVFDPLTLQYAQVLDEQQTPRQYILPADYGHRISSQTIAAGHHLWRGWNTTPSNAVYVIENGVDYWRIKAYCDWPDPFWPGVTPPVWQSEDIPGQCFSQPYYEPGDTCMTSIGCAVWVSSTTGLYAFEPIVTPGVWNPEYDPQDPQYGTPVLQSAYDAVHVRSATSNRYPTELPEYYCLQDVYIPIGEAGAPATGHVRCLTPADLDLNDVSGNVHYEGGPGIPGVAVICEYYDAYGWKYEASGFTDQNGDYLITDLPNGVDAYIWPYMAGLAFLTDPQREFPPAEYLDVQGDIVQDFLVPVGELPTGEWPQFGQDLANHRCSPAWVPGGMDPATHDSQQLTGDIIYGDTAVGANRAIYATDLGGHLHKCDLASPGNSWTFLPSGSPEYFSADCSPALSPDGTTVYYTAQFLVPFVGSDVRLYAISDATGQQLWCSEPLGTDRTFTSPVVDAAGHIFVAGVIYDHVQWPDGMCRVVLYEFDANGNQIRASDPLTGEYVSSPALDDGGRVYLIIREYFDYARLHRFTPVPDTFLIETAAPQMPENSPSGTSPAIADDGTIFVCNTEHVYAYDADLVPLWTYPAAPGSGRFFQYGSPAIGAEGYVYVGEYLDEYGMEPAVTKLDPETGEAQLQWVLGTGYPAFTSPAVSTDGMLYIATLDAVYEIHTTLPVQPPAVVYQDQLDQPFLQSSPIIASYGEGGEARPRVYIGDDAGVLHWFESQ